MDTITHAISGAVIGAATTLADDRRAGSGSMLQRAGWGALFAAFPDSDAVIALFTDYFTYLNAHRGETHSIILLPLWAALLGLLASRFGGLRWRDMSLLAAMALVAHICGDLVTSYGTRMFAPAWDAPLSFPIVFIIDPLFTLMLLAGLVVSLKRRSVWPARIGGGLLLCYLLMQSFVHQQAVDFGEEYAQAKGFDESLVLAFPQPLSPFNWMVVVVESENYHRSFVNLLADSRREVGEDAGLLATVRAAYRPTQAAYWHVYPRWPRESTMRQIAMQAWQQPEFEGFREFALLPYVSELSGDSFYLCTWFNDLRFSTPAARHPFEFAMCREQSGKWKLQLQREETD